MGEQSARGHGVRKEVRRGEGGEKKEEEKKDTFGEGKKKRKSRIREKTKTPMYNYTL